MFSKQAVILSTAAGAGMKSANKDIKDSMFFWGVGRTYTYGAAVAAVSWDGVKESKKAVIEKKLDSISGKIRSRSGRVSPPLKTKIFFSIMSKMQKNGWNQADANYWKEKGWTDKKRPWKNKK